jgi:hypothetical protein
VLCLKWKVVYQFGPLQISLKILAAENVHKGHHHNLICLLT